MQFQQGFYLQIALNLQKYVILFTLHTYMTFLKYSLNTALGVNVRGKVQSFLGQSKIFVLVKQYFSWVKIMIKNCNEWFIVPLFPWFFDIQCKH